MRTPNQRRRDQRTPVFVTLMLFQIVLIVVQLWLFVSVLEALLGGVAQMALPAAVASLLCLGVNVWMLLGIYRMERLG